MDNTIKNNLETIFNNFREMIKVETVVGQAVQIGGATIIPFVDVTFGFGSGSTDGQGSRAGGGGGAKLEPAAVLVIKGDRVEMFSIKKDGYQASAFEKLIAMAPEIIDKMKRINIFTSKTKTRKHRQQTKKSNFQGYKIVSVLRGPL